MEKKKETPILEGIIKALKKGKVKEWVFLVSCNLFVLCAIISTFYLFVSLILWVNAGLPIRIDRFYEAHTDSIILAIVSWIGVISLMLIVREIKQDRRIYLTRIREVKDMIENNTIPPLAVPHSEVRGKYLQASLTYLKKSSNLVLDREAYEIVLGIKELIESEYDLEALRDLLVSEIETLEDGQRNQYLQELSAFEEFFANLS